MAKFFCASLLFFGAVLLFLGHRWLNFTMFTSGFFFGWCVLFVIFIHIPQANFSALRICTLFGGLLGGIGWLVMWHKIHRPFYSAILIIIQSALLIAMVFVHFTKYAVVPTPNNVALFIVIPLILFLGIITYAIFDIKKMHIISCSLLGSYMVIVPFAFYVGSSLNYIVINVISVMAIPGFSEAVGYPPFQYSDIVFLCVWIVLFMMGMTYQMYRERASPPFQPPSSASWDSAKSFFGFFQDKFCSCRQRSDDDSVFDDRPSLFSRVVCGCPLIGTLPCESTEGPLVGYESFPRIGQNEESASFLTRTSHSFSSFGHRIRNGWIELWGISPHRRESQESLRRSILTEDGVPEGSIRPLDQGEAKETDLEGDVGCCTFKKSRVVFDDDLNVNR